MPRSRPGRLPWRALAGLLLVLFAAGGAAAEPLRIRYSVWVGYGPLFLAQEKGYFRAENVDVQLVHGPVGQGDELTERTSASMHPAGAADEDHARYVGSFDCERAGRYGFTVRIVPRHPDLVGSSELGLAAWA